ncbi:hypothetical protein L917_16682 [Phytophthora nicotianae]|uniref:Tc1-like transposase DDE domain-containing protein n=1 Tax=Phytophthora nicotianae TaxID=4792 RepID=W2KE59_PHYNI|nr:hypothetical protein L917_16682 [Phytophthora nicotianae]
MPQTTFARRHHRHATTLLQRSANVCLPRCAKLGIPARRHLAAHVQASSVYRGNGICHGDVPGGGLYTDAIAADRQSFQAFQCQALSAKLTTKLKTLKQEKSTCNSDANKMKRFRFPKALVEHQDDGDYIVYFDETNYDPFCMRSQGRAAKGKRAAVKTPPSKGKIFQIQFVVSVEDDLVLHQLQRGSILMSVNADFVQKIYLTVKNSEIYREYFCGKKVVIVLDNAPAHNQTEARVEQELGEHSDLVLL